MAWAWQFQAIRLGVTWGIANLPEPVCSWLAFRTPWAHCMRSLALEEGWLERAAWLTSELRSRGEL